MNLKTLKPKDEPFQHLVEDIKEHGVRDAVIVHESGHVLSGNRRLLAAQSLKENGYAVEVPCIVVTGDLDQAKSLYSNCHNLGTTTLN